MATLGKSGNSLLTPISDSSWISSTRESGSSRHSSRTCDSGGSAGPTGRLSSARPGRSDLWPQLFSDVNCIALWISSEKILTRLYSVLHWFHKRLEANVKNPRENRCFQTIIVFSFGSFYNSNKCTVLWKIAASLITVSTSVNKEMWVKLSPEEGGARGENRDDQLGQAHGEGVDVPGGVAEEAMEPRPVSVSDTATGEDDFGHVAVTLRDDPARDDHHECLVGRGRENWSEVL